MKAEQMTINFDDLIKGKIEAILFAAGEAVKIEILSEVLQAELETLKSVLKSMSEAYEQNDRGIRLLLTEKTCQLATKPLFYPEISKLMGLRQSGGLSNAALETLAIIAYQQPVTRVDIEMLRGVSSSSSVQLLLDRGLIAEAGRKDAPGRPFLYKTTDRFLQAIHLESLTALPDFDSFSNANQEDVVDTDE